MSIVHVIVFSTIERKKKIDYVNLFENFIFPNKNCRIIHVNGFSFKFETTLKEIRKIQLCNFLFCDEEFVRIYEVHEDEQ